MEGIQPDPIQNNEGEDQRAKHLLEAIKIFPLYAQAELIQLLNDVRPTAEITVIPKYASEMAPALRELRDQGFVLTEKRRGDISEFTVSKPMPEAGAADPVEAAAPESVAHVSKKEVEAKIGFKNYVFESSFAGLDLDGAVEQLRKSYAAMLDQAPHLMAEFIPRGEDVAEYRAKVEKFVNGQ